MARVLKIGTASGTIAGGKTGRVTFKLNRRGRALLAKSRTGRLRVSVVGASRNRLGQATAIRKTVVLRAKGSRR